MRRTEHRFARRPLIILDLERHPLTYYVLPLTKWYLNWAQMTVQDGCITVGAAFRPVELLDLARAEGAAPVLQAQAQAMVSSFPCITRLGGEKK